jgi:hypothetical protein
MSGLISQDISKFKAFSKPTCADGQPIQNYLQHSKVPIMRKASILNMHHPIQPN